MKEITVDDCYKSLNQGIGFLIDVRTPAEYSSIHAVGATNIPLDVINESKLNEIGGAPWFIICQSGGRSGKACQQLEALGEVYSVSGGTKAWQANNLPTVESSKKSMSLERQVRIVAGALVLFGIILAQISPTLIWLSAFVGAGLIFSGLTDYCGMAIILGKMPWNQKSCCQIKQKNFCETKK